eukprot:5548889-Pleurochrysis_carterae.AAC.1
MSAVLKSCAGTKGDVLREARKTIQLLKELAPPGGDELGQPISRATAFLIIRRRHHEAQAAAAADGGRRTGVSCGAVLRASLCFLRDQMGLEIDMDKL